MPVYQRLIGGMLLYVKALAKSLRIGARRGFFLIWIKQKKRPTTSLSPGISLLANRDYLPDR